MARILCLDDDPQVLRMYQRSFRNLEGQESLEILTATDSTEGKRLLEEWTVNLVITDKDMSRRDEGLDFLREFSKVGKFKDIPFILATADASPELYNSAIMKGARGLMGKPFTKDLLHAVARELLAEDVSFTLKQYHRNEGYVEGVVLYVDDEKDLRDYVADALKGRYEVVTAADGDEGLTILDDWRIAVEIVLTDLQYGNGGKNGLWFAGEVKERHPQLPVVMTTADTYPDLDETIIPYGIIGILKKPFGLDKLIGAVEFTLRRDGENLSQKLNFYVPENFERFRE